MWTVKPANNKSARTLFLSVFLLFSLVISFGQNINISEGDIFDGEPYIAVNPENSQHLAVAWMGYFPYTKIFIKTKVSFDGGQTWSSLNYIPHTNTLYGSADVSLAFDTYGNVFLSFIDFNSDLGEGAVFVTKSSDGGLTWGTPVEVINAISDSQKPIDRPWISVDRSGGINDGNIYITSMPPKVFGNLPPPYHPYFIKSTDGGQSFETWRYLDTLNWLAGSIIPQPMPTNCVSSDGTFYAVYPSYVYSQNPLAQFIIASSEDAGNSFSYHTVFASNEGISDTLVKSGYLLCSDPNNTQHLAFFYLDFPYGDIDIFMRESYDKGVTWSQGIRLNDDPTGNNRMQDLVWANFDADGDLAVTWRDRRNGTDTSYQTASEIWGTFRKNGETNFAENFKISDALVPFDTILNYSGNDFMCTKLVSDTLYSVWGDTQNGKLNIWFQRAAVDGTILNVKNINSENFPDVKIFPLPFRNELSFEGERINKILIYSVNAKLIFEKSFSHEINSLKISTNNFREGIYIAEIYTEKGVFRKKIIKTEK